MPMVSKKSVEKIVNIMEQNMLTLKNLLKQRGLENFSNEKLEKVESKISELRKFSNGEEEFIIKNRDRIMEIQEECIEIIDSYSKELDDTRAFIVQNKSASSQRSTELITSILNNLIEKQQDQINFYNSEISEFKKLLHHDSDTPSTVIDFMRLRNRRCEEYIGWFETIKKSWTEKSPLTLDDLKKFGEEIEGIIEKLENDNDLSQDKIDGYDEMSDIDSDTPHAMKGYFEYLIEKQELDIESLEELIAVIDNDVEFDENEDDIHENDTPYEAPNSQNISNEQLDIIKTRLAKGEITIEEYNTLKSILE